MTTPGGREAGKLDALTTLRFVAAALIVVSHARGSFGGAVQWGQLPLSQAVSFFYILSGFILCYVYPSLETREATGRFLLARLARIYPVHVAALLLTLVLLPAGWRTSTHEVKPLLAFLTLTSSWLLKPKYIWAYNSPAWSVSVEAFFYLCFPLLIWRWRQTWWYKLTLAFLLMVGSIAVCILYKLPVMPPEPGSISMQGLAISNPAARLFEFTLGMTMALLYRRLSPSFRPGRVAATALETLALGLAFASIWYALPGAGRLHTAFPWMGLDGYSWLVQVGIAWPAYAALVLVAALQRGYVSRLLSWRPLVFLGEISFSIYLLHMPIVTYFRCRPDLLDGMAPWQQYAFFWAVVLGFSAVSYCAVERPCRAFLIGLWPKRKAAPATAPTPAARAA